MLHPGHGEQQETQIPLRAHGIEAALIACATRRSWQVSLAVSTTGKRKPGMFSSDFPMEPSLPGRECAFWGETRILHQPIRAHGSVVARELWCVLSPTEVTVHKWCLLVVEGTGKSKGQ